jgi:hypothetical protein
MLQPSSFIGSGNDPFTCARCGAQVPPVSGGGYRNHCPSCLHSLHVDQAPGDRAASCRGLMEPVGLAYHSRKGYQIIHRCLRCGAVRRNRIVETGLEPDDPGLVRLLAARPTSW